MTINEAMTEQRLNAIQERVNAATRGPWVEGTRCVFTEDYESAVVSDSVVDVPGLGQYGEAVRKPADVALIANAPQDLADLLAEVERLRARPTVTDNMVERAARESYGPKMWDRLLLSRDTLASVQLSAHRAMTRAALEAALNPGSRAQPLEDVTTCPYCGNEAGPYKGYVNGVWVCNSEQRDDCYTISPRDKPFKVWARNAIPSDPRWGTWRDREKT